MNVPSSYEENRSPARDVLRGTLEARYFFLVDVIVNVLYKDGVTLS